MAEKMRKAAPQGEWILKLVIGITLLGTGVPCPLHSDFQND